MGLTAAEPASAFKETTGGNCATDLPFITGSDGGLTSGTTGPNGNFVDTTHLCSPGGF
jgi:hypothetical protein